MQSTQHKAIDPHTIISTRCLDKPLFKIIKNKKNKKFFYINYLHWKYRCVGSRLNGNDGLGTNLFMEWKSK